MTLIGFGAATAQAVILTWDGNATYSDGVTNASANWGDAAMWRSPDDISVNVTWNSTTPDSANFTGANKTYTVTVTAPATAGDITFASNGGAVTVSGSALTIGGTLSADAGSNVTANASLAGAGSVAISGTLSLGSANVQRTFSGGVTMNAGSVLTVGTATSTYVAGSSGPLASGAFGTGTLTINGGKISDNIYNGLNVANNIVVNQDFSVSTQNGVLSGTMDLAGGMRTITNAHASQFTSFSGKIINGGLIIASSASTNTGGLVLGGNTSTFGGGVTVNQDGVLNIFGGSLQTSGTVSSGALGTGVLTINGGATVAFSGNTVYGTTISNSILINGDFKTNNSINGSFSGPVDLSSGTRTITSTSTASVLTLSGTISNGGLTFMGSGQVVLKGANTYTGLTTVAMSNGSLALNGGYNVVSVPGDLLLTSGTVLYANGSNANHIASTSTVTINGGVFSLNSGSTGLAQKIRTLVFNTGTSGLTFGTATTSNLTLGTGAATSNAIAVTTSGTLAGNGTLGISVYGKAGGTIAPGKAGGNSATGTLTLANTAASLNLSGVTGGVSNMLMNFALASGTNGVSDKLAITSGIFTGAAGTGGLVVNLTGDGVDLSLGLRQTFTIFDWSSATSVTGVELTDFKLGNTSSMVIANPVFAFSNGGKALDISMDIYAVPEPGSIGLIVLGGLAVLALRKSRSV